MSQKPPKLVQSLITKYFSSHDEPLGYGTWSETTPCTSKHTSLERWHVSATPTSKIGNTLWYSGSTARIRGHQKTNIEETLAQPNRCLLSEFEEVMKDLFQSAPFSKNSPTSTSVFFTWRHERYILHIVSETFISVTCYFVLWSMPKLQILNYVLSISLIQFRDS